MATRPKKKQKRIDGTLAVREDVYLSRLAEKAEIRAKGKAKIPAEKVWQELGLITPSPKA